MNLAVKLRIKKVFKKIIPLVVSVLIFLIVVEIGVRMFIPLSELPVPESSYTEDKITGYKLKPDLNYVSKQPEYEIKIKTNSKGLRDYEHLEKTKKRILGIGDSFQFGVGVELEETYLKLIEKELDVETINAGVGGWGTIQELRYLESYGLAYKPDVVILSYYLDNDLQNNEEFEKRYFGVKKESKKSFGLKLRKFLGYSHTFKFLTFHLINIKLARRIAYTIGYTQENIPINYRQYLTNGTDADVVKGWELTEKAILDIKKISEDNSIDFYILIVPAYYQIYVNDWENIADAHNMDVSKYDIDKARKRLVEFCLKNDIGVIDVSERLLEVKDDTKLYYKIDHHWTKEAHKIASEEIVKRLKE